MDSKAAIRHYRLLHDLTLEQVADAIDLSVSQVSRFESGDREPRLTELRAMARLFRVPVAALAGDEEPVKVIGYVGAGAETNLYSEGQGPFEDVERPPESSEATVAVVVRGDSMSPVAEDNWLLYYDNVKTPPTEDLIGQLCVVGLEDGRVVVKRLFQGQGRGNYHLFSANAAAMMNQRVAWAAKVIWIKPR